MKRYGWIGGAFLIVVLLVAVQMAIIANASGYEAKDKVVFAKVQIEKNAVITGDMLEFREVGLGAVHPDALKSSDEAVLKRASMDIEAGEMLLSSKFTSGGSGIIEAEDKSKRLFSVKFDVDQANGWQLADNQYVDVIFVPNHSEQQNQVPVAEGVAAMLPYTNGVTLLKNIRVAGLIDEEGKLVDILESKETPRYVSFEVTEEQAVFLAYAKSNGKIELSCIPAHE